MPSSTGVQLWYPWLHTSDYFSALFLGEPFQGGLIKSGLRARTKERYIDDKEIKVKVAKNDP